MKIIKEIIIVLLTLFISTMLVTAQETHKASGNEVILAKSVIDTLKANIPRIMEKDSIPGVSVAVVSNEKILWICS